VPTVVALPTGVANPTGITHPTGSAQSTSCETGTLVPTPTSAHPTIAPFEGAASRGGSVFGLMVAAGGVALVRSFFPDESHHC
jgi:hypothetical protein